MIKTIMGSVMLVLSFMAAAQEAEPEQTELTFEPASLSGGKLSLENIYRFPKKLLKSDDDINIAVRCDASIGANGKVLLNFCFEGGETQRPFVDMINKMAKRGVINPAKVNGTARKVWFQYYVVFMKSGKKTSVEVIPNSGLMVEQYGLDYTSPQRYREGSGNFGAGCGRGNQITVNAVIDVDGSPLEVVALGDNLSEACVANLQKTFMQQKYIPSTYKGMPIKSYYSETIFDVWRVD